MSLNWKKHISPNPFEAAVGDIREFFVYFAEFDGVDDVSIRSAIEQCIDKSVSLLGNNIDEQSQFYLCEWDVVYSILTIVVTDREKENDSPSVVKCSFRALDNKMQKIQEQSEDDWEQQVTSYAYSVRDWIRDYLTTCSGFMGCSLVAVFHAEDRSQCSLL